METLWQCVNCSEGGGAGRPADAPGLQTSSPKMLQKLWPQPQPQNLRSGGVQFNDVQDMWCIIESLSRVSRMLYRHYWYMYNIAFSHQSKTKTKTSRSDQHQPLCRPCHAGELWTLGKAEDTIFWKVVPFLLVWCPPWLVGWETGLGSAELIFLFVGVWFGLWTRDGTHPEFYIIIYIS